ncbi:putative glycosyl transferase [Mycolicibacterium madagascariense]|uniref:Putative glycosyl transferase n=1 Tax=Mycolicibacterium madagascariense TaxID=212765 RepID=A0A7I7XET0_9MYCO|nr:glycosyltransferase [Mycolicibacterium madagascariense]MCV7015396.1 glycosyltransferase [Mycolicibacterium madagascariense]BBZ27694.1 putative glycosyl transferase [Mycolicibacterium madagascariense]
MPVSRIAIVHERLTEVAGSEHVVEQLALQWPEAEVHTSIARPEGIPGGLTRPPRTTRLDALYHGVLHEKSYAPLMPLMPHAFRHVRFGEVDAVIASHHAFATQAALATTVPVIAYVHSPARWAWDPSLRAGEGGGRAGEAILTMLSVIAKRGETRAAPRLRTIVANSTAVARRITDWWHRDAVVVPPPVDTEGFTPDPSIDREDFFLLAGRLVPYKRPDLAIRAAAAADVPLVVAGDGRSMKQCREVAGPKTTFLGRVAHDELLSLHRRTRALLMPGVEDFGIVPVESMATGTPVIALGQGGAIDSVIPGTTGLHVAFGSDQEIVDGFAAAMRSFDAARFDPVAIRQWAEGFSRANFRRRMQEVVDAAV